MSCLKNAQDLQQMMAQGQVMEAFDKYYHNDVQVHEMPTGEVRNGKEAQRQAINQWFGMIKENHGGGVGHITSNEDDCVTCAESWTDVTMQDGSRMKMEEVAVQKWKDDQIIEEKFYYQFGPPPQM